jgi:hypothetical protein
VLWLGMLAAATLTPAARADTSWTRISDNFDSNIVIASLLLDGSTAYAAWSRRVGPLDEALDVASFQPSLTAEATSLSGPVDAAPASREVGYTPQLFPKPGGGVQIAFDGFVEASPDKTAMFVVSRNADGSFTPPAQAGRPYTALGSALLLSDGTPIFSTSHAGGARVLRGVIAGQSGVEFQPPGGSAYLARLGQDAMGRLWLVWYTIGGPNPGLSVQQVNPATGAPLGSLERAPASDSSNNNSFRIAFACSVICRVLYGTGSFTDQRLVSWAPGEATATTVAAIPSTTSAGRVVTAAYRGDGRLWVAWHDGANYRFKLGDARGSGGEVLSAGHPPGAAGTAWPLNSIAVPDGLLLAANWRGSPTTLHNIWVNVVTVPPPLTSNPGPRDVELKKKGKGSLINVQYRLRTACTNPCPARAEIRTRTGGRIYGTVSGTQLRGDGKIVLGTRRGIRIPPGRRIFFSVPIKRSALLKTPFYTRGGYRFAETRLRVWLRTPRGEALTLRDGRIKVSIARIKSGDLPELRGIL